MRGWLFAVVAKIMLKLITLQSFQHGRCSTERYCRNGQSHVPPALAGLVRRNPNASSRGVEQPIHTTFLCRRSCCNRPAWPWSKIATGSSLRSFRLLRGWPAQKKLQCSRHGAVWDITAGRGRYMRAAKEIVRRGSFPRTTPELMELQGVGRYTAAAVASIAFGEPVAVVDGNVKRVIDRLVNRKAALAGSQCGEAVLGNCRRASGSAESRRF